MWIVTPLIQYYKDLITDDTGRPSLGKSTLFWGFIFSSVFMWKLLLTGGFNENYFLIYMALVSGQHLTSKYIDNKGKTGAAE